MSTLTAAAVLELALGAGLSRAEADVMTVIAHYESGWNPNNNGDQTLSRYGSVGLWQIFTGAHTPSEFGLGTSGWNKPLVAELYVPRTNAAAARVVFKEQGFGAWSTYNDHHAGPAWAALLKQIQALKSVGGANPPPVVAKPARNYLARKGNTNPRAARAIEFAKAESRSADSQWGGMCLRFVRTAEGIPARAPRAIDAWRAVPGKAQHSWYTAPVGCPVFWSGGSGGAGHIAIADGLGNVWSSDIRRPGRIDLVPEGEIASKWGLKRLGWAETLNGVRVYN